MREAANSGCGWDIADGFSSLTSGEYEKEIKCRKGDPLDALNQIAECSKKSYLSSKDFHEFWDTPNVKRKLRNLSQRLEPSGKIMVIINPNKHVPDELKDEVANIDFANASRKGAE